MIGLPGHGRARTVTTATCPSAVTERDELQPSRDNSNRSEQFVNNSAPNTKPQPAFMNARRFATRSSVASGRVSYRGRATKTGSVQGQRSRGPTRTPCNSPSASRHVSFSEGIPPQEQHGVYAPHRVLSDPPCMSTNQEVQRHRGRRGSPSECLCGPSCGGSKRTRPTRGERANSGSTRQKPNLTPSCAWRGNPEVATRLVSLRKSAEFRLSAPVFPATVTVGLTKFAWFVALNTSQKTSSVRREPRRAR